MWPYVTFIDIWDHTSFDGKICLLRRRYELKELTFLKLKKCLINPIEMDLQTSTTNLLSVKYVDVSALVKGACKNILTESITRYLIVKNAGRLSKDGRL